MLHATWVTSNTAEGEKRPGFAKCGIAVTISGIGEYGGLDWPRLRRETTCLKCAREMDR